MSRTTKIHTKIISPSLFVKKLSPLSLILLSSCSMDFTPKENQEAPMSREDARKYDDGNILGDDFLLFGGSNKYDPNKVGSMPVNPFLWKASLDVISFMPLASSDATGGVILTDWYTPGDKPNERIKLTISIRDRVLRADALKVVMNKQIRGKQGGWVDATVDAALARDMEDLILTKARELKVKNG